MTNAGEEVKELRKWVEEPRPKYPEVTFKSFLEETPPDTYVYLTDLKMDGNLPYLETRDGNLPYFETPDVVLFCENTDCKGPRIFRCKNGIISSPGWKYAFLPYQCRNCGSRFTQFAIAISIDKQPTSTSLGRATCIKLGQIPAFGPQTPTRLIKLIGRDRETFLQGRRAEHRGLGIGAFAYYRRVVENQKNRIIEEIAKVAKLLGSTSETDAIFAAAINETRFAESVAMVKDFIPQVLMIGGHNPLTLLHTALSRGLHNPEMTDEHCLQLAQSIRTILAEFAERASEALKDDREIKNALSVLIAVPNGPKAKLESAEAVMSNEGSVSRAE